MFLIIDNYDSFTFNLYQLISKYTKKVSVMRNDKVSLDQINKMNPEAIILSPGPGRPENAGVCVPLIKAFYMQFPILGVCLGHQAIGCAFGAKIIPADKAAHGKGTYVFHNRKNIYKNMPLPFKAGRYHSLIIDKNTLSHKFITNAENPDAVVMGIKHKDFPVYGMQFHPESILTPHGELLIQNFINEIANAKELY
ncbi:anthranilate synthase component II [Gammaproteobacteria bacterium]